MESQEFEEQILNNLDEVVSLEDLNQTQKYLRKTMLLIFSKKNEKEYEKLSKEYGIEKTKELFYKFVEPI